MAGSTRIHLDLGEHAVVRSETDELVVISPGIALHLHGDHQQHAALVLGLARQVDVPESGLDLDDGALMVLVDKFRSAKVAYAEAGARREHLGPHTAYVAAVARDLADFIDMTAAPF